MSPSRLLGAALLCLAQASCRAERPWPPEPATVHFGEENCASCNMIVSEERYAAQAQTPEGVTSVFDDVGCLLVKLGPSRPDPRGVFVRAFDGSGWVRGDRAFVFRSPDIHSPMGFGFASFASRELAEAEARRHPGAAVVPLENLLRDGESPAMPAPIQGAPSSRGEMFP